MVERLLLFFIISPIYFAVSQYPGTLRTVQILFRHGQRAPTKYLLFPGEDTAKLLNFHTEPGEMTNTGIMQEYQLGESLKRMYRNFTGERYIPSELKILAGMDNRTVVSALAMLSSFFPPSGDQVWNHNFLWQPIAVHTEQILDHCSFGAYDNCPVLRAKILKDDRFNAITEQDSEFKNWLSNMTKINVADPSDYQKVLDSLVARQTLDELPLPDWARNVTMNKIFSEKKRALHSELIDIFLDEIGGWIMNLIVGSIEDSVNGNSKHKLLLYAAHDSNIQTIGKYLNIKSLDVQPDYASYLAFEHHYRDGDHIVEVWFSPKLNASRRLLQVPGCGTPCNFESFKSLRPRITSNSWMITCMGEYPFCEDYSIALGAMILSTTILAVLCVLLIFICCAYRKRLNKLLDPEQQQLLDK